MTAPGFTGHRPLSFAQQRLWFLDQLIPRPEAYNVAGVFEVRGTLKVDVLRHCFAELMSRHEPLRTAFSERAGRPEQDVVAPELVGVPLSVYDLSDLTPAARCARVSEIAARGASRPFDLRRPPLWRAELLHFTHDEHTLLLTLHHIVADGWSLQLLIDELTQLYSATAAGRPSPLAPLPIGYADYAARQRERLTGDRLDRLLQHWRSALEDIPLRIDLPTDFPRPAVASHRGDAVEFAVPDDLHEAIERCARAHRVSPFIVQLAAFAVVLHRYTRQTNVVVGSPVANRTHVESEGLVGFFANSLPLRCDLAGDPTFEALITRLRATVLQALDHAELPFERLVAELEPVRDLAHHPVFQVLFAITSMSAAWEQPGLRVRALRPVRNQTAKFDLSLLFYEGAGQLWGVAEYATDLFDRCTIERLVEHLLTVTRAAVADPVTPVSRLPLLKPADRETIVVGWNATIADYPANRTLSELFEAQTRRTPNATALIMGDRQLSYHELNTRANRLARHLRYLGVRPDARVAICMQRSVDLAISVLAVLKAGGACVPLDPAYPPQRLAAMLVDARPKAVLTCTGNVPMPESTTAARPVLVDQIDLTDYSGDDLEPVGVPDNLAYVIYTSGPTDKPKGVALPQRALVNLVHWHNRTLNSGCRTLQFASASFDMSCYEMFTAWLSGGTLVMLPDEDRHDVVRLARALADHRIAKAMLPAPVLQQLAEALLADPVLTDDRTLYRMPLEEIVVAGEKLVLTRSVAELFRRLPNTRLHHHYGPTETHVVVGHALATDPDAWPAHPPIGRPISNTWVYILDDALQPVPIGVPGEIHLGGVGLARGYLGRPGLTAECFIPDPYRRDPGQRMYRTGDLARYRADGVIELLGRIDSQVKVGGVRAEPAEIDRSPRTPTEATLGKIWSEILRVDRISVHDSFFELGGHSLLAIQIIARMRTTFGVVLGLAAFFQHPTIAELAAAIDGGRLPIAMAQEPIQPVPRQSAPSRPDQLEAASDAEQPL